MSQAPLRGRRPPFRIYAITDLQSLPRGSTLDEAVRRLLVAAPAGRIAIQLRDKDLPRTHRAELGQSLRKITRRHGALLIINGDVELARSCGADGVHFPEEHPGLTQLTDDKRGVGANRLWIGVSCHDIKGVERAERAGADFVTLSPVLPSPGKAEPGQELGWTRFAAIKKEAKVPIYALGGLDHSNAKSAAEHGAYGIGAIRSVWQTSTPHDVLAAMLEPFAPIGCGARGGRIGKALSSALALLIMASLWACSGAEPLDDLDNELPIGDDDDSAAQTGPVPVDIPLPGTEFGLECLGSEPDDMKIPMGSTSLIDPPWPQATDCGQVPAAAQGLLIHIHGSLQDLVVDTWDGDNDTFHFRVERESTTRGVLRWDPLQGDFDARVLCERAGAWDDLFDHQLATTALAESADAKFTLEAGASCWVVIVGYSGLVGSYDFWLEETEPS